MVFICNVLCKDMTALRFTDVDFNCHKAKFETPTTNGPADIQRNRFLREGSESSFSGLLDPDSVKLNPRNCLAQTLIYIQGHTILSGQRPFYTVPQNETRPCFSFNT